MASSLTKPVTRKVVDVAGQPLLVTFTADGILFRRPRAKTSYLLPYGAGETRAQVLANGVGAAGPGRRSSSRVSRGLLTT